jgi:predicted HicB family RNase H-like nuclease
MSNILTYNNYSGSVDFSAEDNVFYGKIIGINDLVNFEGVSVAELKASFEEAVEDYLETCKKLKKEPEKTFKGSFNVRVPSELHREAFIIAQKNKITLNELVKKSLKYAVEHEKELVEI